MNLDLLSNVKSLCIGINYDPNFSIIQNSGSIIDELLYSNKSNQALKYFDGVYKDVNEVIFNKKDSKSYMRMNPNDTVIEIYDINQKQLESIFNFIKTDIVYGQLQDNRLKRIKRIGCILRYEIPNRKLSENYIDKTVSDGIENIADANVRFSIKLLTDQAKTSKKVNHYDNVIYNVIKKINDDKLYVTIDYQMYFQPLLAEPKQIKYDDFIERALKYNKNKVNKWLLNNYLADE